MTSCKTVFIQTPLGLADDVARLSHQKQILAEALLGLLACVDATPHPYAIYSLRGPARQAIKRAEEALTVISKRPVPALMAQPMEDQP